MHPHARDAAPVRLEVALGVAPEAARHAGERLAADELADLARADERAAVVVDESIAMPSAGPPSEHALIGSDGTGERKHAPTSVPPEKLMIGTREPPTFSKSQR